MGGRRLDLAPIGLNREMNVLEIKLNAIQKREEVFVHLRKS